MLKTTLVDTHGNPLCSQDSAHRGASLSARELSSWNPGLGSADSDLNCELTTLVSRSRDLARNHGVASGAIQTLVDNVVGTGLRLAATPDYRTLGKTKDWAEDWSKTVESLWRNWAESTACDAARTLNFTGLTTQVFRSTLINGEALAIPLWTPKPHNQFATTIQLIESDRLSNPEYRVDDKNIRNGIEIDRYGAPNAYFIRKHHPGDDLLEGINSDNWQRIPALTQFGRPRVLHIFEQERTGQRRGKPFFTPIMPLFKFLDHYERAELQAVVANAMIAAFVESPVNPEEIIDSLGGGDTGFEEYQDQRSEWRVNLKPGSVPALFPGDKLASFTPSRPNTAYSSFVENVLRHIGTGLNIPYELLMKDFSKTNYSSARAALLEARRSFNSKQAWLSSYWAKPVYTLWLEEAINKGLIEAPDFYQNQHAWTRCKWIGAGRGWVDPVKEVQAAKIRMEIGIATLEDECAAQGLDWEEVLEQRAREQSKITELGLTLNLEEQQPEDDKNNEDMEQSNK